MNCESSFIKNIDCFDGFKLIKPNSVGLVVVDLPYGCFTERDGVKWDTPIDLDKMWIELKKVCKPTAVVVMFCTTLFGFQLIKSNPDGFKYDLIWQKSGAPNFLSANKVQLRIHEMIYIFKLKNNSYTDTEQKYNDVLRAYFKKIKGDIKESQKKIDVKMGNTGTHHCFNNSQFGICTEVNYKKLTELYKLDKLDYYLTYAQIKEKQQHAPTSQIYNVIKNDGAPYSHKRGPVGKKLLYGARTLDGGVCESKDGKRYPTTIYKYNYDKEKIHPTQKPVELIKRLIETYSNEGDVVMDFTMGSGSTIVASILAKRKYIGFEKDAEFFKKAEERIKKYL